MILIVSWENLYCASLKRNADWLNWEKEQCRCSEHCLHWRALRPQQLSDFECNDLMLIRSLPVTLPAIRQWEKNELKSRQLTKYSVWKWRFKTLIFVSWWEWNMYYSKHNKWLAVANHLLANTETQCDCTVEH